MEADSVEAKLGLENIEGALKERLEVYRRTKVAAEAEGNTSKARRYGRICKQFEDAVKLHARGKPVPLDELPVPPGFPPLSSNPQSNDATAQSAPEPGSPENSATTKPAQPKAPIQPKPPIPPPRTGKRYIYDKTSHIKIITYTCIHMSLFIISDIISTLFLYYIFYMIFLIRTETKPEDYIASRKTNATITITST